MFAKLKRKPIHDPPTLSWILIRIAIRDAKYPILRHIRLKSFRFS